MHILFHQKRARYLSARCSRKKQYHSRQLLWAKRRSAARQHMIIINIAPIRLSFAINYTIVPGDSWFFESNFGVKKCAPLNLHELEPSVIQQFAKSLIQFRSSEFDELALLTQS